MTPQSLTSHGARAARVAMTVCPPAGSHSRGDEPDNPPCDQALKWANTMGTWDGAGEFLEVSTLCRGTLL